MFVLRVELYGLCTRAGGILIALSLLACYDYYYHHCESLTTTI